LRSGNLCTTCETEKTETSFFGAQCECSLKSLKLQQEAEVKKTEVFLEYREKRSQAKLSIAEDIPMSSVDIRPDATLRSSIRSSIKKSRYRSSIRATPKRKRRIVTLTNPKQTNPGQTNPGQTNPGQTNPGHDKPWTQQTLDTTSPGHDKPSKRTLKRKPGRIIYPTYNMDYPKRGFHLIFAHEFYDEIDGMMVPRRKGTETDIKSLTEAYSLLGFKNKIFKDQSSTEIKKILDYYASYDHNDHDCLAVTVMTHGNEKYELCARDSHFPVDEMWKPFQASDLNMDKTNSFLDIFLRPSNLFRYRNDKIDLFILYIFVITIKTRNISLTHSKKITKAK
jgi:Caspase domain